MADGACTEVLLLMVPEGGRLLTEMTWSDTSVLDIVASDER